MDKQQALYTFWHEATGLEAYEESKIPDKAVLPYCTYQTITGALDEPVFPIGHIWVKKTDDVSWNALDGYLAKLEAYLNRGRLIAMDDQGVLFVTRGTPFAQRVGDDVGAVGYLINLGVEYFSN